jgi:hypothetical protein
VCCAQVFGIRDAVCDPDLDPACNPGQATPPENNENETDAGQATPAASEVTSSAASAGAAASSAAPTVTSDCDEYCTLMEDACGSKALRQYSEKKQNCIDFCAATFGASEDTNPKGDTLACRMAQAQLAKESGGDGCVEAGPTGGSVCGDPCENYCRGLRALCEEQANLIGDGCVEGCRAMPHAGTTFVYPALPGFSFECRAYHLQLTVTIEPELHCEHSIGRGAFGNQPCAAPKE